VEEHAESAEEKAEVWWIWRFAPGLRQTSVSGQRSDHAPIWPFGLRIRLLGLGMDA